MDTQRRFIDEFLTNSGMTVLRTYHEKESGKCAVYTTWKRSRNSIGLGVEAVP